MTFPPQTARAIAAGRATTLRIPAKRGKAGAPYSPCSLRPGSEYAVPAPVNDLDRAAIKRGDKAEKPPLGHVRVISIGTPRETPLDNPLVAAHHERPVPLTITPKEAKAEGHDSTEAFKRAWVREHDHVWLKRHAQDIAWARYTGQGSVSWILLERYRQRWEGSHVWVIRFELVTDVRYLSQPDPIKAQGDYTHTVSRAIDPLPVIDEQTQDRYSKAVEDFCIGRQLTRQREAAQQRADRGRSMRVAA